MSTMVEDDILQEILVRLPVKPLVRCKSLSKLWCDFISCNKSFRQNYLSRNKGTLLLGFFVSKHRSNHMDPPEKVRFLPTSTQGRKRRRDDLDALSLPLDESLSFLGQGDTLHVMGSSNGFLLCSPELAIPRNYIICNPINKQRIALPKTTTQCRYVTHGFIFHTTTQPCLDRPHSYKVLRALCYVPYISSTTLSIEIFSSDSPCRQWELLNLTCPFSFNLKWTFHWTIISEQGVIYLSVRLDKPIDCLLIVDRRKKECLHLMDFPARPMLCGTECFGQSDGRILFGDVRFDQVSIWVLEDKDDCTREWSLRHKVHVEFSKEFYPEIFNELSFRFDQFIAFHPTNPHVLILSFHYKKGVYNLETSRLELFSDFSEQGWTMSCYIFPYTYGLIGPHLFLDD